jgi:hypothetical protein
MNKQIRIFVFCYPHLGTLDNWIPIISNINGITPNVNFTLIIPDAILTRNLQVDNAVVSISNDIFDTVLIKSYDNTWFKYTSIYESIRWYKDSRKILRLYDTLSRLSKKHLVSLLLRWPLLALRNIIYRKELKIKYEDISEMISSNDCIFYDIHIECSHQVIDILNLFQNNNKYSLSHGLNASPRGSDAFVNIKNKDNIRVYSYNKSQCDYYGATYGIDKSNFRIVGIPRHDKSWIKTIQDKSAKLPHNFDNNNSIIILSRHVNNVHCSLYEKIESVKNIKKLFIDKLGMKLIIKQHPNEKIERIFASKADKIYEDILGKHNYGSTWIYSDLHVFALGKEKNLAISLNTGVIFDMIAMDTPCIEYIDSSIELKNSKTYKRELTQFVKHGFIEGVVSYKELCNFVDRWSINPSQNVSLSKNTYKDYFPEFADISKNIAAEILLENNIID